jgi:lactate dehydrogenase-like 2-hydroxyacid dehydrogenase
LKSHDKFDERSQKAIMEIAKERLEKRVAELDAKIEKDRADLDTKIRNQSRPYKVDIYIFGVGQIGAITARTLSLFKASYLYSVQCLQSH